MILAPSQMVQFIVIEKSEETIKNDYFIELGYTTIGKKERTYSERYNLVIQYAGLMGHTETKKSNFNNTENQLKNIADYLDSIRNKL